MRSLRLVYAVTFCQFAHSLRTAKLRRRPPAWLTAFLDVGMGGGAYLIGAIADAAGFGAAYATPAVLCLCGAVLLAVIGRAPVDAPA